MKANFGEQLYSKIPTELKLNTIPGRAKGATWSQNDVLRWTETKIPDSRPNTRVKG